MEYERGTPMAPDVEAAWGIISTAAPSAVTCFFNPLGLEGLLSAVGSCTSLCDIQATVMVIPLEAAFTRHCVSPVFAQGLCEHRALVYSVFTACAAWCRIASVH